MSFQADSDKTASISEEEEAQNALEDFLNRRLLNIYYLRAKNVDFERKVKLLDCAHSHTHTHIYIYTLYIYICIYIYIVCLYSTDLFVKETLKASKSE